MRKIGLWLLRPPSVVILFALCYPSCVEVIVEVVFELVGIPLSVEVIVVKFWLCALSLYCEVIVVVHCLLYKGCFIGERNCVLLVCICQILSGDSLCGMSCMDV